MGAGGDMATVANSARFALLLASTWTARYGSPAGPHTMVRGLSTRPRKCRALESFS